MKLNLIHLKQTLNKAFLKEKVIRSGVERFKVNLTLLLDRIDEEESEENVKGHLITFLNDTYYRNQHLIATKGRTDLVIHEESKAKSSPGVLFEVKRPRNQADMVTAQNANAKALQELLLYYLQERVEEQNTNIKYCIVTNVYDWYIFDAAVFDKTFYQNSRLRKDYEHWRDGRKTQSTTDFFYRDIARPFLDQLDGGLPCTYFNLKNYEKPLRNQDLADDKKLVPLFKVFSPTHLLKLPFANDSNSLDKRFYNELLHIIGLEETKEKSKKIIKRRQAGDRQPGALLENAIATLQTEDRMHRVPNLSGYGNTKEERLFNVALELCITWINRILFLKLLEAQLLKYHDNDRAYRFLSTQYIADFDELNELFFEVLAKKLAERPDYIKDKFARIPYLNSSLFEISELEDNNRYPIVGVSWLNAVAYCNWLSQQNGYQPVYRISDNTVTPNWQANGYRLPTEAEWEYAARSGGRKEKWAGTSTESQLSNYANYYDSGAKGKDGYVYTAPVGSFSPNGAQLHDMSGNVWEWCWDWYSGDYYANSTNANNPKGPTSGSYRVLRGGSWPSGPASVRCANRLYSDPDYRNGSIGFRLSRAAY